jgi:hypothetical protein
MALTERDSKIYATITDCPISSRLITDSALGIGSIVKRKENGKEYNVSKAIESINKKVQSVYDTMDLVVSHFNAGDSEGVSNIIKSRCRNDVILICPVSEVPLQGKSPLLAVWTLFHVVYPDAVMTVVDKRVGLINVGDSTSRVNSNPSPAVFTIVNILKITGTRISERSFGDSFHNLLETLKNEKDPTSQRVIDMAIAKQAQYLKFDKIEATGADVTTTSSEPEYTFVTETVLTVDDDGYIIDWNYQLVASTVEEG